MFPRITNQHGCVRLHNFYFYVEEGLPKSQVYLWVYQDRLRVEHNNVLLIEYECLYDEKNRKVQELTKPLTYEHKYISRQLKLFEINAEMLRVLKIERIKANRSINVVKQFVLFEATNV